jgi:hypothetical protein
MRPKVARFVLRTLVTGPTGNEQRAYQYRHTAPLPEDPSKVYWVRTNRTIHGTDQDGSHWNLLEKVEAQS